MNDADFIKMLKFRAKAQTCRSTYNYGEDRCDCTYDDDGVVTGNFCGEPCDFIMHGDQEITLKASEVRRLIGLTDTGKFR